MELFRSEEEVNHWGAVTDRRVGAVFEPKILWTLASRWYDDRFDLHWRRKTVEQRQAILRDVGLEGDFWRIA